MIKGDTLLFHDADLRATLEAMRQRMAKDVSEISGHELLNTSIDDWCLYFEQQYHIAPPVIIEEAITVSQREAQVDVSHDIRYGFSGDAHDIPGNVVSFHVPFDGAGDLFKCQPSRFTLSAPYARIGTGELILSYENVDHNAEGIKAQFNRNLQQINDYLAWIATDVGTFNLALRGMVTQLIEKRREKLLKDQGLVSALGFPLKRRDDAPRTYVAPVSRKVLPTARPSAGTQPYVPEPELEMVEYDHILSIISGMVSVIERSPRAFAAMGEEDLRQHFLVQLNGQYQGQATGETFNYEGKTDILIRENDRNLFIAECKFWHGPDQFKETIDQLLRYTAWRDTKTAIILFNRNKSLSAVLEKIPVVVKAHPNYKRDIASSGETAFRYILCHRNDPNRELTLTVLVFDVPS